MTASWPVSLPTGGAGGGRSGCISPARVCRGRLSRRFSFRRGLPPRPRRWRLRRLAAFCQDLGDPNHGVFLAMSALAPRILAAPLLEGDDLRTAHVIQHFGSDRCTRNRGGAKYRMVAAD